MDDKRKVTKRILAFCVQGNGIGWAILEVPDYFVSWGTLHYKQKNLPGALDTLMQRFSPTHVAVEKLGEHSVPKGLRSKEHIALIQERARKKRIKTKAVSRANLKAWLAAPDNATKHELASALVIRITEMEHLLPPKRKIWQSEDRKMLVLMAFALSLAAT